MSSVTRSRLGMLSLLRLPPCNVRCGSLSDATARIGDVRFTTKSGHVQQLGMNVRKVPIADMGSMADGGLQHAAHFCFIT